MKIEKSVSRMERWRQAKREEGWKLFTAFVSPEGYQHLQKALKEFRGAKVVKQSVLRKLSVPKAAEVSKYAHLVI